MHEDGVQCRVVEGVQQRLVILLVPPAVIILRLRPAVRDTTVYPYPFDSIAALGLEKGDTA